MEDKELFNFFRTRSASFEEMPSDELWNKIQNAIEIPKKTSSATISKTAFLITFSLATLVVIVYFINKNKNQIFENSAIPSNKIEVTTLVDSLEINTFQENKISLESKQAKDDTLKKKKLNLKKSTFPLKNGTFPIPNTVFPLLKMDSIQIIDSKILIDTIMIKPKEKGGRLLFETKEILSKSEFDAFVKKILRQTERDFGSLIVIKAKGHQPFRHLVKPIDTLSIQYKQIKNPLIKPDSIYFNKKM